MARILSASSGPTAEDPHVTVTLWCTTCQVVKVSGRGSTRQQAYDDAVALGIKWLWRIPSRVKQVCPNCARITPGSS